MIFVLKVIKIVCIYIWLLRTHSFHYTTGYDLHVVHIKLQIRFPECFILLITSPCRAEKNDLPMFISKTVAFDVVTVHRNVCGKVLPMVQMESTVACKLSTALIHCLRWNFSPHGM